MRAPTVSSYADYDVREEPMLTGLLGYFDSIGLNSSEYDIYDFHLDRSIKHTNLLENEYEFYVFFVRDVGDSYHYSFRLINFLLYSENVSSKIVMYGQVAPLRHYTNIDLNRVTIVNQSEQALASVLGVSTLGSHFEKDLRSRSYFSNLSLEDWQLKKKKGVVESTRGCPFRCNFCFINAGENYEKRWAAKTNDSILHDLKMYVDQGIRKFTFLDSEFLGGDKNHFLEREQLLNRIISELPKIKYMIWCRADTMLRFNQYDLFKRSGLNKVLVGIESFYQPDLDAFRKGTTSDKLIRGIRELMEREIYGTYTFITFNRNTTLESLEHNIGVWEELHNHPKAKYLGVPNFAVGFEIVRDSKTSKKSLHKLTNRTYIKPIIWHRGQENYHEVCFPVELEPLMEIYRQFHYECNTKRSYLSRIRETVSPEEVASIDSWFLEYGRETVKMMKKYLNRYKVGKLGFDDLKEASRELAEDIRNFYKILPENRRYMEAYEEHTKSLDFESIAAVDHGWDHIIPPMNSKFQFELEKKKSAAVEV